MLLPPFVYASSDHHFTSVYVYRITVGQTHIIIPVKMQEEVVYLVDQSIQKKNTWFRFRVNFGIKRHCILNIANGYFFTLLNTNAKLLICTLLCNFLWKRLKGWKSSRLQFPIIVLRDCPPKKCKNIIKDNSDVVVMKNNYSNFKIWEGRRRKAILYFDLIRRGYFGEDRWYEMREWSVQN